MSNVIRFPSGRVPPATEAPLEGLVAELTAVEIEIARARLSQIRSETRRANALWAWFWCKRILACGLLLWLLSLAVPT